MTIQQAPGVVPEYHVGDRVRKARELLGEDRQTFARTIGVDPKSITRYELGQTVPRLIVLRAIALATGVDLEWLRTGVPSSPAPTPGGGRSLVLVETPESGVWFVSTRIRTKIRPVRRGVAA